ncbi:MAG: hypothetical protein B0D92_02740 [Spirochaeta sp. LUC14_002_19_P3]|nr:MAG: hypothetical protein B0D92_02740 [Spirochaeta sp. LUC14_002_19_P3]
MKINSLNPAKLLTVSALFFVIALSQILIGCPLASGGNTPTDTLTYLTVFKDGSGGVDGLATAWSVAVSQDGKNVYVTGVEDDALAVFNRDTNTGELTYSTVFKNGIGGVDGLAAAWSVAVSQDGKNVYVTGVEDDALAVFNRD